MNNWSILYGSVICMLLENRNNKLLKISIYCAIYKYRCVECLQSTTITLENVLFPFKLHVHYFEELECTFKTVLIEMKIKEKFFEKLFNLYI